jgi:predicted permease
MIELFTIFKSVEHFNSNNETSQPMNIPVSWIIIALLISFGTAYIAYTCNEYEKPASRALATIIAFFFSGFYLIYYFIVHVLFDKKCGSRSINNVIRNITKK